MADSSDDDVPLGQRQSAAAAPATKASANPARKADSEEPAPRPRKASIVDESSDEEAVGHKKAGTARSVSEGSP